MGGGFRERGGGGRKDDGWEDERKRRGNQMNMFGQLSERAEREVYEA